MAAIQDLFTDASKIASMQGAEVFGGLLLAKALDARVTLSLNGANQYSIYSAANYRSGDSAGTFCAWIRSSTLANMIWSSSDEASTTRLIYADAGSGRMSISQQNADTADVALMASSVGQTNRWNFVAFVSTGSAYLMYIDGVSQGFSMIGGSNTGDWFADTANRDNFVIGAVKTTAAGNFFNGIIDDARLFDVALTQAQMEQIRLFGENPVTPVGWWKFNEGSGSSVADSSGNGATLTLVNSPTWTTTHPSVYSPKSRIISTDLLSGLGSTTVNSFLRTIGKHPGGGSGKLQFSSDNATWKNANGDLVDNAGGYSFDGVNDVISMGNVLNWTWNAPNSISLWFKTTTTSSLILISKRESGSNYRGYEIQINNTVTGRIRFVLCNVTPTNQLSIDADTTANDGNWHHLVAVTTNGTAAGASLYLDGVPLTTSIGHNSLTGVITNTIPFQIGARNSTFFFPGSIDDVRVYDFAVSAAEVESLYQRHEPTTTTPVGWWKLDGNANDSGSGGNNGTVNGATSVTDWWELPQFGEPIADDFDVLSFDGVNDRVVTGLTGTDTGGPSVASAYTLTAWVRPNSNGTLDCVCGWGDASSALAISSGLSVASAVLFYAGDGGVDFGNTRAGLLVAGQWTHLALVYDGSQSTNATRLVGYVNGIAEPLTFHGSAAIDATLPSLTTDLSIGDWGTLGRYWTGLIANVAAYNAALSAATILADFQNGYPSSTSRVAYWPLNEGSGTNAEETDGNLDGTISGATWIKDIARPQPTTPVQQTLSLSLLSFTASVYYRALYSEIVADRAMALDEVTIDYTADGLRQRITQLTQAIQTSNNW